MHAAETEVGALDGEPVALVDGGDDGLDAVALLVVPPLRQLPAVHHAQRGVRAVQLLYQLVHWGEERGSGCVITYVGV